MTLMERLEQVKSSELFKLAFEGKVLGLRAKFFNVNTEKFEYYDFELSVVRKKDIVQFVKSIRGMRSIQLMRNGSGLLVSEDEVKNNLIIGEFETEADALKVLEPLKAVYEAKE